MQQMQKKKVRNDGCMTTYERFCREAYNLLKKNIKADNGVPSEGVEKFLKKEPHDSEFYFYCGVAASNVVNDISHKNGSSRLWDDDVVNDLVLFKLLIGM